MSQPTPSRDGDRRIWKRFAGAKGAATPCPGNVQLAAYLDGRLGDEERETVEAHLAQCARCRETVADIRSMPAEQADAPAVAPASVVRSAKALVAARPVAAGERERSLRFVDWVAVGGWGLAAAASIAVCFAAYQIGAGAVAGDRVVSEQELLREMSFGVFGPLVEGESATDLLALSFKELGQ